MSIVHCLDFCRVEKITFFRCERSSIYDMVELLRVIIATQFFLKVETRRVKNDGKRHSEPKAEVPPLGYQLNRVGVNGPPKKLKFPLFELTVYNDVWCLFH
jgi:hypothetical protein